MKIERATGATVTQLWSTVEPRVEQAATLEEAAQALATAVQNEFSDSAVLARVYVTVPFDDLPQSIRAFVESLAGSAGAAPELKGTTPVLSLIGTHGQEGDWNDDGTDTIGVYRGGAFLLRNSNTNGFADWTYSLGIIGDLPIGGNWDALP